MKRHPRTRCLCSAQSVVLFFLAQVGFSGWSIAQDAGGQIADHSVRGEVSLGFQQWNELSQLTPSNGRFDSTGLNLGGAVHWRMKESGNRSLLAGLDFMMFTNESNIRHVREDVTSRGLSIVPSVKFMFDSGTGPRYSVDLGAGFYLVDIAEVDMLRFEDGWYSEDQLWEDTDFGGYAGVTIDFRSRKNGRRGGFFMATKIHYFDLGDVADEDPSLVSPPTLGSDAGSLSGPMFTLQFGYHLGHPWQ